MNHTTITEILAAHPPTIGRFAHRQHRRLRGSGMSAANGPLFLIDEYVERVTDGTVGRVAEISTFQGKQTYDVIFGRDGHREWTGESLLRRRYREHAHVTTHSADCDGRYERGYTDVLSSLERVSAHGDIEFRERVVSGVMSLTDVGTLHVTPSEVTWEQTTEEGYVNTTVEWCDYEKCAEGVVGCQCMDRVFRAGQEDYPSHLAAVLVAAGVGFVDEVRGYTDILALIEYLTPKGY